jgi:probable selenate reductase molybdenum-binding subunit
MTENNEKKFQQVGISKLKVDGPGLVSGQPLFVADFPIPGLLQAKVLWSPHAHARIKNIDTEKTEKLCGVKAVLTYKDVPRIPFTTAGQGYPEPSPYDSFILDNKVRFVGDRVAAVVAETEQIAEEALKLIKVDYEILPAVFDPRDAIKPGAPIIHDEKEATVALPLKYEPQKNICAHVDMKIGDREKGLRDADFVIERDYDIHYGSHAMIEPHITAVYFDSQGRMVILTSTQVPFHVRRIVARALNIAVQNIRVIKPRIGGGFGGKQEVLIEPLVAALALKIRRPVCLKYSRAEEFVSGRSRHPQLIKLRTGVKKDGTLTAIDMNILMNNGAYGAHALTIICNSGSKVLPLVHCENISFNGDTVYTNLPVCGAYRGYGATEAYFAFGVQMDEMAEKIGMDIVEWYKKIHIREGETSPVFAALGEGRAGVEQKITSCGLDKCLELGAKEINWNEKRNQKKTGRFRRGVGMVALMQGSAIPEIDMGSATIKMNEDGSFNLLIGATDLGTGSDTILAQIAAETLGVPTEKIIVTSSDTDLTPFDVGAYASSTTYLSGQAVLKTAQKIKQQIVTAAAEMLDEPPQDLEIDNGIISGKRGKVSYSEVAHYSLYEKNQFQIIASDSHIVHKSPPPFAAHFAEVEVDILTGKVKVIKYVAAVDCGTAINPKMAEGQNDGAILNGISYALTERYIFNERGKMLNPNFDYYKIFSTADIPEIKTILVPTYEPTGPYGAKSVSEIGINGPCPAIANAIYNAIGVRLYQTPFTPDKVLAAIKKSNIK